MSDDLRKAIAQAIYDPGATEGYKGERSLTDWQTDAVMRAIIAMSPSGPQQRDYAGEPLPVGKLRDPIED